MAKDKYPSILSPQVETIEFIILQIFYATRAVLKTRALPFSPSPTTESLEQANPRLVYTKTVDKSTRADWLVKLRISCAFYLRATREKMASGLHL